MLNDFSKNYCLLCKNQSLKIKPTRYAYFKIAFCKVCGFWFILPRPPKAELNNIYQDFSNKMENFVLSEAQAKRIVKKWNGFIKKYNHKAEKILEAGCGSGHLLFGLKHYGYEVFGCDVSQKAKDLAKNDYGLEIENCELPDDSLRQNFDVLILSHLIEHLVLFKDFLNNALQFLKPSGILIMACPNANSLGFRIFKGKYSQVSPPVHLNFFNKKTIGLLLKNQCQVLTVQTTSYDSTCRNSFFFNFVDSLLFLFGMSKLSQKKDKLGDRPVRNEIFNGASNDIKKMRKYVRIYLQVILFPLFWVLDKLGLGDNVVVTARKV